MAAVHRRHDRARRRTPKAERRRPRSSCPVRDPRRAGARRVWGLPEACCTSGSDSSSSADDAHRSSDAPPAGRPEEASKPLGTAGARSPRDTGKFEFDSSIERGTCVHARRVRSVPAGPLRGEPERRAERRSSRSSRTRSRSSSVATGLKFVYDGPTTEAAGQGSPSPYQPDRVRREPVGAGPDRLGATKPPLRQLAGYIDGRRLDASAVFAPSGRLVYVSGQIGARRPATCRPRGRPIGAEAEAIVLHEFGRPRRAGPHQRQDAAHVLGGPVSTCRPTGDGRPPGARPPGPPALRARRLSRSQTGREP